MNNHNSEESLNNLGISSFSSIAIATFLKKLQETVHFVLYEVCESSCEDIDILNVDGSSSESTEAGRWGFMVTWDRPILFKAELVARYHDLDIAWSLEMRNFVCYSDSVTASLQCACCSGSGASRCHRHAAVVNAIWEFLHRQWTVRVLHALREGNFVKDGLAKMGASW